MDRKTTLIINKQANSVIIQETIPPIKEKRGQFTKYTFSANILYENTIDFALGDIISEIERHFPPKQYFDDVIHYTVNSIFGDKSTVDIIGFPVRSANVISIYEMFKEKNELTPLLDDLDHIRLTFGINGVQFYPLDKSDYNAGMTFGVKRLEDVIYGYLYFCAFNHIKLKKCAHCGKWFTTETFKKKYCDRMSPVERYSHLQCRRAAEDWRKKLRERETAIYDNWKQNLIKYGDRIDELRNACNTYLDKLSVDNLQTLESYLYSDDKPKQTRPNRRKKEIGA